MDICVTVCEPKTYEEPVVLASGYNVSSVCTCYKLMRFILAVRIPFVTKCQIK